MSKTKIVLLGVLHNYHNIVKTYSLSHLEDALVKINPDLILTELKSSELETEQKFKLEYNVILPYAKKNKIEVFGLDPEEPQYSDFAKPYIANQKDFTQKFPIESRTHDIFENQLFNYLINDHWTSVDKTQSEITNALFDLKHRTQEELFGAIEKKGWSDFNEYYSGKILQFVKNNIGKTILITIGIEHVYYLQKKLRVENDLEILNTQQIICN